MTHLRHFIKDTDISSEEQKHILKSAIEIKKNPDSFNQLLSHKILGMIFTKSSTRTRVSFEAGIIQLGGQGIFLSKNVSQMGRGEPISDTGQTLSRYLDILMIRTFLHSDIVSLAQNSSIPVINGLDDTYHPCQALADLLTIKENFEHTSGLNFVYVGDGNNIAHSLLLAGSLYGINVSIVSPSSYSPDEKIVSSAKNIGEKTGSRIEITDCIDAIDGADVVYTDVWVSMGQEEEDKKRKQDFENYQITPKLMSKAHKNAIFLHCLPAHRGYEVHKDVIDGHQSRVFDQAENRLHVQKALMAFLMKKI